MTRINIGVPPKELTSKHLIAEHRELKRIPNGIRKGKYRLENIPPSFTLGTGHVKFFYNKLGYLKKRYLELYTECLARGFNVQNYESAWEGVPESLMNDYIPSEAEIQIVKDRIAERLANPIAKQQREEKK